MAKKYFSKALSLVLSLVLCMGMVAPAFAAGSGDSRYCGFCVKYSLEYVAEVAPTCQEEGVKAHYTCTICGRNFHRNVGIPTHYTGKVDRLPKVSCEYSVPATCVSAETCKWCGAEDPNGKVNPNNHVNTEVRDAKEATCTAAGYTGDTWCLDCGEKIAVGTATPVASHNFTGEYVQKNVGTGGPGHAQKCVNEGCTASGMAVPCTFGDWTVTEQATCEEKGAKTRSCTVCGRNQEEEISATGHKDENHDNTCDDCGETICEHNYVQVSFTDAVCERRGSITVETCSKCGKTRSVVGQMPHHAWDDGEVSKDATCTGKGEMTYTCTREGCTATKTEEIKANGHDYEQVAKANPTCTTGGKEAHMHCIVCGHMAIGTSSKTEEDLKIAALGHDWGEWALNDDQTAIVRTCGRGCTETETVDLPNLPIIDENTEWSYEVTTAATCAAEGVGEFTYTKEGEEPVTVSVTLDVDPDNHVGETEVRGAYAATATTPGYTGDTHCVSCDALLALGTGIPATGTETEAPDVGGDTGIEDPDVPQGGGDTGIEAPDVGGDTEIEDPNVPLGDGDTEIDEPNVPLAGLMTRAEFVNYLWYHEDEPESAPSTFTDVAEDHEYAQAIGWAQANGIAKGIGNNEFAPDDLVTVEQAYLFLARYARFLGIDMPELAALVGKERDEILDNADEVLAEFFGEKLAKAV